MVHVKDGRLTWRITPDLVDGVVSTIRDRFHPERIIVFGSAARGETEDGRSDLDLLVVMDTDLPSCKRASPIRLAFEEYPCAMDILVFTPAEVAKWNGTVNHIITEAFENGKVMYEKRT